MFVAGLPASRRTFIEIQNLVAGNGVHHRAQSNGPEAERVHPAGANWIRIADDRAVVGVDLAIGADVLSVRVFLSGKVEQLHRPASTTFR
jgi:hypothetical protein